MSLNFCMAALFAETCRPHPSFGNGFQRKLNRTGIADEIAATATCYSEFLCSGSDLSHKDLSYLLQFENPLDVLRDRWVLDQSTEQGTRFLGMLESLRSEGHAEQDYPLDEAYAQTQKNEMTMQL